jgi:hypothetical protein
MSGASIEETLELWAASLREVKARMRPLFTQERVAASAGLFLDGLLGEERRKTGWMRAEAAGDPGPWRQQAILGGAAGMPTLCATLCATMRSNTWRRMTPFWSLTRPVF